MKNLFLLGAAIALLIGCKNQANSPESMNISYPETQKTDQVDEYFGTKVEDPYRWLENDTAQDVGQWVKAQNQVTFDFLNKIPFREGLKARYRELLNYTKMMQPIKAGNHLFFYRNEGLQNQAVLYIQEGADGEPEVFIDPNKASESGIVTFNLTSISRDNRYAVVSKSEAGSDWAELQLWDIASRKRLAETIEWVKFTQVAWYKDGFFYTRYPQPEKGLEYSAATQWSSIYYHKLGTDPATDKLIYRDTENPNLYHNVSTTQDEAYLILYISTGTNGFETHYKALGDETWEFTPLFEGFDHKSYVLDHQNGSLVVLTDVDAPNKQLVSIDLDHSDKELWKVIIPQSEDVIESVKIGRDLMVVEVLQDASSRVYTFDTDGKNKTEVQLPGPGSVMLGGLRKSEDHLYYTYTSFTQPGTIYRFDLNSKKSGLHFRSELKGFNPDDYESRQVFFESKDGTKVPMFIVHKKGISMDGNNPTYLYAYGGFNISLTPSFSASRLLLLENGGVFAMPNLRGGGEFGEEWHEAGMRFKKQNVFDDFIAAGEALISMGYTSSAKLAIAGGSNGGLLVGAVTNQRPDLFQVAFPGCRRNGYAEVSQIYRRMGMDP